MRFILLWFISAALLGAGVIFSGIPSIPGMLIILGVVFLVFTSQISHRRDLHV